MYISQSPCANFYTQAMLVVRLGFLLPVSVCLIEVKLACKRERNGKSWVYFVCMVLIIFYYRLLESY